MSAEKLADYSQVVTADELDGALRAGGFDGVWHYCGDDFVLREEDPLIVADIRSRGWLQGAIFVPSLGAVNGAADAQRALSTYSYPPGSVALLDIEPVEFDQDPAGWARAADAWCGDIRAAGLSPWVYGVDRTVAACGNLADAIMRAVPGMCDPAAAGPQGLDPAFKAGWRAVQCDQGVWNGVSMDVTISEVSLMATVTLDGSDPVITTLMQEIANVQKQVDDNRIVIGVLFNLLVNGRTRAPDGSPASFPDLPIGVTLGALDANAVAAALAVRPLPATLSDAERDGVAVHVLQRLSRDTAGG